MHTIRYDKEYVKKEECIFEIEDLENVFLKAKYNYCNATTNPHFAQFRDGKDIVVIFIEKYHDITVSIRRTESFYANSLSITTFIKNLKVHDTAVKITKEEFFEYYNKLTRIQQ